MKNACKSCRREGEKLFLKGERCYAQKCAMIKRPYGPGDHGPGMKKKVSEYGRQLREKRKLSAIFGISASMLEGTYKKSDKASGNTTENLMKSIILRLDNFAYTIGLFSSRSAARQAVSHRALRLNGRRVSVASITLKAGDEVEIVKKSSEEPKISKLPAWTEYQKSTKKFIIKREPMLDEIDINVNESLVAEYYSR
jgi:small subunit ribosomal protein S4